MQQSTDDTQLCAPARWRAPEINTESGKTSDYYSASLTQYLSDRADLLVCALTSGVLTNRQEGRAISVHANRRLAKTTFFVCVSVSKCNRCRSISKVHIISEKRARRNTLFSDASSAECSKTTQRKRFETEVFAVFCKYRRLDVKKKTTMTQLSG